MTATIVIREVAAFWIGIGFALAFAFMIGYLTGRGR